MRKSFYYIIVIAALLFASCSKKEPDAGAFSSDDMVLTLGGKTFYFGEDASGLLDFLGEPDKVTEILSCYYEGYDKTYKYGNIDVITFPKEGKDILDEVIFYDSSYSFKGKVTVGSTKDDVIKGYGDKYFTESDAMIYNETNDSNDKQSPRLTFILKNDRVTAIDFYSGSYFSGD